MPRKGDITFVPSKSTTPATMPLDLIPVEIKRDIEEVYAALQKTGEGRMQAEYDTVEEVKEFRRQAMAYCALRPTDVETIRGYFKDVETDFDPATIVKGGPLKFRLSPVKDLPETEIAFRVTDIPPKDPNTEKIDKAVKTVETSAAPTDAPTGGEPSNELAEVTVPNDVAPAPEGTAPKTTNATRGTAPRRK